VTLQEAIQKLEDQGWRELKTVKSVRQYHHASIPGLVTLSGDLEKNVPGGVLRSLWQHIQAEE
jgi:predicted RNA binding protein YcfA (HicA-like mRNA interferase family)